MIELRFVERPNNDAPFLGAPERVLQYRTWKIGRFHSDDWGRAKLYTNDGRDEPEWTDWQDVPTVKEGA